jgi:hypothetical protein
MSRQGKTPSWWLSSRWVFGFAVGALALLGAGSCSKAGEGCHEDSDCSHGLLCCNSVCVASDEKNCQTCGNACGQGETCCSGGGGCVTLNTTANCGSCGVSCDPGTPCCAGACASQGNVNSCGACGNACAAGDLCCTTAGLTACTDPTRDPTNCGYCGNVCSLNETCSGGKCQPADGGVVNDAGTEAEAGGCSTIGTYFCVIDAGTCCSGLTCAAGSITTPQCLAEWGQPCRTDDDCLTPEGTNAVGSCNCTTGVGPCTTPSGTTLCCFPSTYGCYQNLNESCCSGVCNNGVCQ